MKKTQFRSASPPCAYCGRPSSTQDHVVPRSLFSKPLPNDMVTVRCCSECNAAKKPHDEFLRDMLTLDYQNYNNPVVQGLYDGPVARAIERNQSKLAKVVRAQASPTEIFNSDGESLGKWDAILIDNAELNAALAWIVWGLSAHHYGVRVPHDAMIETHRLHLRDFQTAWQAIGQFPQMKDPIRLGKDVCSWASLFQDEYHAQWLFSFYGVKYFSVSVFNTDDAEND